MATDSEMGLVNLETTVQLHEYHIDRNIQEIQRYPLDQGTKLFTDSKNQVKYFILPNMLIMPYSYLSVLQHYQGEA